MLRRRRTIQKDIRRLEQEPSQEPSPKPRTAVVVSGGGHLGATQVGMLRALVEAGIEPDVYVSCSVGALNATAMAAVPGEAGIELLERTWSQLRTEDIFPGKSVRQAWQIARRADHLYPNTGLIRLITSTVPVTHFHHLKVPLRIVAADVQAGTERVFGSGPLLRPLLATTALPGIFPPVRIGDGVFVDGGIVNNVPINHVAAADRVYVLAVSDGSRNDEVPQSSFGLLLRSFEISRSTRFGLDLDRFGSDTEIVVVPPPELPEVRFPDLSQTTEMMELAYETAREFLGSHPSVTPRVTTRSSGARTEAASAPATDTIQVTGRRTVAPLGVAVRPDGLGLPA